MIRAADLRHSCGVLVVAVAVTTLYGLVVAGALAGVVERPAGVIAFSCGYDVCAVGAKGGRVHTLARTVHPDDPQGRLSRTRLAWSPDGRRFAFVAGRQIWVMNADGSRRRRLTKTPTDSWATVDDPVWSPDGKRIAFTVVDLWSEIDIVQLKGGSDRPLVRTEGEGNEGLDWSPKGRKLTFSRGGEIYVADADGRKQRRLTPPGQPFGAASRPAWSPDGRRIAFIGSAGYVGALYVMRADGSRVRRVTRPRVAADAAVRWSPAGDELGFVCAHGPQRFKGPRAVRICVVRSDGTGLVTLPGPTTLYSDPNPSWSPDGRWLTFGGCDGNGDLVAPHCRVYVAAVSGRSGRSIAQGVNAAAPVWQPRR